MSLIQNTASTLLIHTSFFTLAHTEPYTDNVGGGRLYMTTSLRPVLFSLLETVNSKLELYWIQWYENPVFVFRNSMSSDGELSAIGKKEWEKRLKVPYGEPIFRTQNRIWIWSGFSWVSGPDPGRSKLPPDIGKIRYFLLEELLVGLEACPRFWIQKLFLRVTY